MDENIKVYVRVDSNNVIIEINSIIFIQDLTGWIYIDEGQGDKFSHAQGNYFPKEKPLKDEQLRCNYKLVDNKPVELTEEKEKLFPTPAPQPTKEEILSKEVAILKIEDIKKDVMMTNALQTIASLKVEVMNLKGGNA